jgi:hypothetical protein
MFSFVKGYFQEELQEKEFFVELIYNLFLIDNKDYREDFLFIGTKSFPEESFNKHLLDLLPSFNLKKKNKEKKSFIFSSYFEEFMLGFDGKVARENNEKHEKHILKL